MILKGPARREGTARQAVACLPRPVLGRASVTGFSRFPELRRNPGVRLKPVTEAAAAATLGCVADQENQPLSQLLEELGAQLDWVREYL